MLRLQDILALIPLVSCFKLTLMTERMTLGELGQFSLVYSHTLHTMPYQLLGLGLHIYRLLASRICQSKMLTTILTASPLIPILTDCPRLDCPQMLDCPRCSLTAGPTQGPYPAVLHRPKTKTTVQDLFNTSGGLILKWLSIQKIKRAQGVFELYGFSFTWFLCCLRWWGCAASAFMVLLQAATQMTNILLALT